MPSFQFFRTIWKVAWIPGNCKRDLIIKHLVYSISLVLACFFIVHLRRFWQINQKPAPIYRSRILVAPTGGERSECQPCGLSVEDRNEVNESTEKEGKARSKSFERLLRLRNSSLWPRGSDLPRRSIRSRSPLWEPAFGGTHGRIRTSGLPLRRRPLYPTELRGQDLEKYKRQRSFCQLIISLRFFQIS